MLWFLRERDLLYITMIFIHGVEQMGDTHIMREIPVQPISAEQREAAKNKI